MSKRKLLSPTRSVEKEIAPIKNESDGLGSDDAEVVDLVQAENRFDTLINTIDGIIWESPAEGDIPDITYVSRQIERILGYTAEEWKRAGSWDVKIHPDDRDWVLAFWRERIKHADTYYELEYRYLAKDDRVVWVRSRTTISYEKGKPQWLRGIIVDVTQQKAAEDQFRTMFMAAPLGMVLDDYETGDTIQINPAYSRIVGREIEEIHRLGWEAITHPDDIQEDLDNFMKLKSGEISSYKMPKRFKRPDNSFVWTELTATLINEDKRNRSRYLVMVEDITERKLFEEKIWKQANYDSITGLPNRNMFNDRLNQLIKQSQRDQREFALLLIDLDQFKDINDTLGHDKGDELLAKVAKRLKECARRSDTVARLGGDEFIILLQNTGRSRSLGNIAQKFLDTLSRPIQLGENTGYISASIGITLYPHDATDSVSLIKNADQAMYVAKDQGRNRYHLFTIAMQREKEHRMGLTNDLRNAIKNHELELHYQPIIDLNSNQTHKAEALLRWNHPSWGQIRPAEFIPLAEEARIIIEIGNWVLFEADKQCEQWRQAISEDFQISINVSPTQFDHGFNSTWNDYLNRPGFDGGSIGIEITESLLMTSNETVQEALEVFREAGMQISLDDFGTGYSSLSYLRKFDIDYLKIDSSFVKNLSHDSDDLILCSAIVIMAHKLGIKVVAEGIETSEQRDLLKSIDCDFGQGYFFSRPVLAEEFVKLTQAKMRCIE